ncbi:MAG: RagB/SusD family nutrient uptake outer membrane protein [Bacteroidota bacterium]
MTKPNLIIKSFLAIILIVAGNACTDIRPEVFDVVVADEFFVEGDDEPFLSALGSAYTNLYGFRNHNSLWSANEVASDEAVIATKGADWFDGGQWIRMHQHEFNSAEASFDNAWNFCYQGINTTNRLIFQFSQLEGNESAPGFIAELQALRALYYFWLIDMFGNVPIVDKFVGETPEEQAELAAPANNPDFQTGRTQVFNFIETELLNVLNAGLLSDANDASSYARMNEWATRTLLAKLYLNAEVYTGTPRYAEAAEQANLVIQSGLYSLEANYLDQFSAENEGSVEQIFSIPYDEVFATGFNIAQMTLHYQSELTFDLAAQPWNGYATLQEFYESFEPNDRREDGFLVGEQFTSTGERVLDAAVEAADPDGAPLTFTPEINELEPNSLRQAGARFAKNDYTGAQPDLNSDFAIFRYADVLLMRAEALWRMDAGSGEALDLINQIRIRAGVAPFAALTADDILAERGREFYSEGWRRNDQVRFGTFTSGSWSFKDPSADLYNIFPIPENQIDANDQLNQTPGF